MKKLLSILLALFMVFIFVGCSKQNNQIDEPKTINVVETTVNSTKRDGVKIPTYITLPADYATENTYPLVVMIHGHHGNHNEWGGYDAISNGLAEKGIIVVTMDFSGCDKSTESIALNAMSSFKADVSDVLNYMKSEYKIGKVGGFGYSMGGRIILEMLAEDMVTFDAIEFVAPAESTEDLKNFLGGVDGWAQMSAYARETGEMASFQSVFGEQLLSALFFDDIEKYMDADDLASQAAAKYNGPSLTIYATNDTIVSPKVSQKVADAFNSTTVTINNCDHSYSFYYDDPVTKAVVNDSSIDFFVANLMN